MAWSEPSNTWLQLVAATTKTDEASSKIYKDCIRNTRKSWEYVVQRENYVAKEGEINTNDYDEISYFESGRPCWNYKNFEEN